MPKPEGRNVFSNAAVSDFKKMQKRVLGVGGEQGDYGGGAHNQSGTKWYWAKTSSAVTTGTLETPSTFTYDIWLPDPGSSADPRPFVIASESELIGLTGVNRSTFTAVSGTVFKMEYAFGEWTPKWADC